MYLLIENKNLNLRVLIEGLITDFKDEDNAK